MKTIVRTESYLGCQEGPTVYKYTKNKIKKLALADLKFYRDVAKEEILNEDDIEDDFEYCSDHFSIQTSARGIYYDVVEMVS